jgi:flagellar motor switch protein FliG
MISKEVEITFRVKPEQAAALLEFLSCVLRADIMRALNSPEQIQAFDFASERLRVALRKVVDPKSNPTKNPTTTIRGSVPPRWSGNSRRSRRACAGRPTSG